MKARNAVTLLGGALLLAGCSHQAEQEFTPGGPVAGLQVAIGDCMVVRPAPTAKTTEEGNKELMTALATALISQGVNYLGRAATAAGEAKTWTTQGARNFQATASAFPQCIQVVRGQFFTEGPGQTAWSPPGNSGWPSNTKAELDARGLFLTGMPDFLFEAQIVPSQDLTSFAIRPAIATYLTPIDTRFLRPGKERNIALFFAITPPGTKPTLDSNPGATLVLGTLQPASTRRYSVNGPVTSPYESPWFTLTLKDAYKPLTLSVLMSETQGEQAFLAFMGSLLSDPKVIAAANADLANQLVPSVRQANELAADTKHYESDSKREGFYLTAREKLQDCVDAKDPAAMRKAAKEAVSAMRQYFVTDTATRSPKGNISKSLIARIDVEGTASSLKSSCQSVLKGLPED